jgi:hypothetical protein
MLLKIGSKLKVRFWVNNTLNRCYKDPGRNLSIFIRIQFTFEVKFSVIFFRYESTEIPKKNREYC